MKIIVTGSLGRISRPLTEELVQKGHAVTVISSQSDRQQTIESLGATAAIGSLEAVDFLADTFTGADAVYTMIPPANFFGPALDLLAYYRRLGNKYVQAIGQAGVRRVVNLSSVGAHLDKDNGILRGAHDVEQILNELPPAVAITHMRPVGFYYNLYGFVSMIKNQGFIAANYGANDELIWVSPLDIAAAVAEELEKPAVGTNVRYVASDELTGNETASLLGAAIGKPDLTWTLVSDEHMQRGLVAAGMNPQIAAGMVEMYASQHSGLLTENYYRNKPAVMGKVKLADFARDFAAAFNQATANTH